MGCRWGKSEPSTAMTGLDPITVAEAGPRMADALNMDWSTSRAEVVRYLNKYREYLFTNYDKFKLFDSVFHCICVSRFRLPCARDCQCETYYGFTLPPDVAGVVGAWEYGFPLAIRSRWRETHSGINNIASPRVEVVEMSERFPTERDLTGMVSLKVFVSSPKDAGKAVVIEVEDADWNVRKLQFDLLADGWAASDVLVRRIISVVLPPKLDGHVTLAQCDGYELSYYAPTERVPSYRRFRVAPTCRGGSILIQGTKRFQPVWFDTDIVEVGNGLVMEAAAKFFKFSDDTTDSDELRRAAYDEARLRQYLNGLLARHRGHAIQDGSPFRGRPITRKKTLPGYR